MAAHEPSAEALRRAQVFWHQAQDDAQRAKKQHRAGAHLESGYLSFQAAINALAAVAYLHGQFRGPTYSAAKMAALCEELDPRFGSVAEACRALEAVQEHSPFRPPEHPAALAPLAAASLAHVQAVLQAVRAFLKENRRRYFKP